MNSPSGRTQAEHALARLLTALAALLTALDLLLLIGALLMPDAPLFRAPAFWITNTIAGVGLIAFLAWLSAADVRRYRPLIYALIGGFVTGAVACLLMLASRVGAAQTVGLLVTAIAFAALAAITGYALNAAQKTLQPPWLPWIPDKPISTWERITRIVLALFALGSLGAAVANLVFTFLAGASEADLINNPLMLAGSSVKLALLGLCALPVALDVRRYTQHTQSISVLIAGNLISFFAVALFLLLGVERFGNYQIVIGGTILGHQTLMLGALILDAVVVAGLFFLNRQINRWLLNDLGFLSPSEFRALEATAETLVSGGDAERVPAHEIVLLTDRYLKSFRSTRLRLAKLAAIGLQLSPLIWLKQPINYLYPEARQAFINARFKEEIINPNPLYRAINAVVRAFNVALLRVQGRSAADADAALSFTSLLEAMLRFNMQLTYIGYYNNPDVWDRREDDTGIGYVPFSRRTKDFDITPRRPHPPLAVTTPDVIEREGIDVIRDADVVIVGSGAAGSILAEQLVEQGRRVLLLEKGLYVHPDDFNEDEVDMISRLYSDGALQISQALRFTILQGSCVGGTTVVNNAVCFDTPQRVLDVWNGRGTGTAIDPARFYESQAAVRKRMRIQPISAGTRKPLDGGVLNHGDGVITQGVHKYFQGRNGYQYDVIQANIVDCLGCGYCNIGCRYGRKLSMLDEVLPSAQHKCGADNLRILSEAEVVKLAEENGTITQVHVQIGGKRKLIIDRPKTVIVSAGTIASSWLLMQSGIGRKDRLPVGRGLSFNMGSPLHALFDRELNSYDGLQIAHYLSLDEHPGFVYETWYNPPVAQALAMPGWLETHFQNMQHYNRMAAVGVLVGTESNAYLTPALITGGPDVVFQPSAGDLKKLVDALVILGDIMFAAGALEVYASTRRYVSYRSGRAVMSAQSEVDQLRDLVQRDEDILLGTGHPQGGNAVGTSPRDSVVGQDFKVFGYDNLYVCDASVFPTSTTVNPQLTVMSLAHYAAAHIG